MINFTFLSVSLFLNVSLHSSLVQLELSCLIPWGLNPQSSLKLFNKKNPNLFLFSILLTSFTVSCFLSCDALILFFYPVSSIPTELYVRVCPGVHVSVSVCACVSFYAVQYGRVCGLELVEHL